MAVLTAWSKASWMKTDVIWDPYGISDATDDSLYKKFGAARV